MANLEAVHWEKELNIYCDTVVRDDTHRHACHKGYISIFPFLTGLLGAHHVHLPAILDLLRDPAQLWTDHGLRSLNPESVKYGTGDDYWRSPIWININYPAVYESRRLAQSSQVNDPSPSTLKAPSSSSCSTRLVTTGA